MDETKISTMPAEDHEPALRLGATLREKRIAMGLSVADVAAQIRLAPRQIEALEADDLAHLPELPFVRGFVRSYAKLLQLDAQPLLATLPDPHPVADRIEPVSVEVPFNVQQLSARQNQLWLYATAVVAVLVALFAIWHFATPQAEVKAPVSDTTESSITLPAFDQVASMVEAASEVVEASAVVAITQAVPPTPLPPVTAPEPKRPTVPQPETKRTVVPALKTDTVLQPTSEVSVNPAAQAAAPLNPLRIRIVFGEDSWTEVKDATGRLMSSKLNPAGTELNLNGQPPYELVIGNARFVQLYRRSKLVDLVPYINSTSEVARLKLE